MDIESLVLEMPDHVFARARGWPQGLQRLGGDWNLVTGSFSGRGSQENMRDDDIRWLSVQNGDSPSSMISCSSAATSSAVRPSAGASASGSGAGPGPGPGPKGRSGVRGVRTGGRKGTLGVMIGSKGTRGETIGTIGGLGVTIGSTCGETIGTMGGRGMTTGGMNGMNGTTRHRSLARSTAR
jgi:hypothetical protein